MLITIQIKNVYSLDLDYMVAMLDILAKKGSKKDIKSNDIVQSTINSQLWREKTKQKQRNERIKKLNEMNVKYTILQLHSFEGFDASKYYYNRILRQINHHFHLFFCMRYRN